MKGKKLVNIHLLTSLMGLSAVSALCSACEDEGADFPVHEQGRRTVLIYQAAQNSLGNTYLKKDSIEIQAGSAYLNEKDRLLVYVDDASRPRIYEYAKDGGKPQVVRRWSRDECSASPETLREVLAWTKQYYPSDEYGLVLWSHATGWLPSTNKNYRQAASFGIDSGPGGSGDHDASGELGPQMDVEDIAAAVSACGIRLRYCFFDACLMQGIETCYALRNATDYVVAAPISTPAAGANYEHQLKSGLFSEDPADIARTYYADITDPAQQEDYENFGIVISAVRTEGLDELAATTAELLPESSLAGGNSPDMTGVQHYAAYTKRYDYRPHNYDAADAMRHLLPQTSFFLFRNALEAVVAYKAATPNFYVGPSRNAYFAVDEEHYSGMSMFVPQAVYARNAAECPYGNLNEAFRETEWHKAAGWDITGW